MSSKDINAFLILIAATIQTIIKNIRANLNSEKKPELRNKDVRLKSVRIYTGSLE